MVELTTLYEIYEAEKRYRKNKVGFLVCVNKFMFYFYPVDTITLMIIIFWEQALMRLLKRFGQ